MAALGDRSSSPLLAVADFAENFRHQTTADPRRLRKLERSRPIDVSVALAVWRVSAGSERSLCEERGLLMV